MAETTIVNLCNELYDAIKTYYQILFCNPDNIYDKSNDTFLLSKIDKLKNNIICTYQNSNISTVDDTLIQISNETNIINQINSIKNCIDEIIKSVDNCINSCFNNLHPELIKSINIICNISNNVCDSVGRGSIDIYTNYNNASRALFNSIIDLCKLIHEIKYATELINNSNDTFNLILFLQIISYSIFNYKLKDIYNPNFFKFINNLQNNLLNTNNNNEYIVNNTLNAQSMKLISKNNFIPNINNDFLKLHFDCILALIDDSSNSYLRFSDMNNYITIISLIFGSFNSYLYSLD